jgi:hypothetical protein
MTFFGWPPLFFLNHQHYVLQPTMASSSNSTATCTGSHGVERPHLESSSPGGIPSLRSFLNPTPLLDDTGSAVIMAGRATPMWGPTSTASLATQHQQRARLCQILDEALALLDDTVEQEGIFASRHLDDWMPSN